MARCPDCKASTEIDAATCRACGLVFRPLTGKRPIPESPEERQKLQALTAPPVKAPSPARGRAAADVEQPEVVKLATKLLWIGWAMDCVIAYLVLGSVSLFMGISLFHIWLVMLAVPAFFIFMLSAGRNWARISYLAMYVWSLLSYGALVISLQHDFPKFALANIASWAIEGYALVRLFSADSSAWFRHVGTLAVRPTPSAAVPVAFFSMLIAVAGAIALVDNLLDRSRAAAFQEKCKGVGAKFLRRPSMQVRSVAHDWDSVWGYGPSTSLYELDGHGRIASRSGAGVSSPAGLDFEEHRYSPNEGQFSSPPVYVRLYSDRKLHAIDALSADVLVMHQVSNPVEAQKAANEQGPLRYTLTVRDRRTGEMLATMVYWVDIKNGLGCGANQGGAIDERAFIQKAIALE